MKRRRWLQVFLILILVIIAAGSVALWQGWVPLPWGAPVPPSPDEAPGEAFLPTVPVQPADTFITDLEMNSKLAFRTVHEIKAPFEETVAQVTVKAGDLVEMGQSLVVLDRQQLSADLDNAWFELTKARQALADLVQPDTQLALLEAQSELLVALEELQKLEDGPSRADIDTASLAIREAEATYTELQQRNDPNSTKVREARYALRQAENEVQRAQTAYDAVGWRGDIGALGESAALQSATIAFESAQNAYNEASKPPTDLEIQQAQLAIARAHRDYTNITKSATSAQIEQARVRVAQAGKKVKELKDGPAPQKIQEAEVAILEALRKFEETRLKLLTGSDLVAPIDGLVTKVIATKGQLIKEGDTVAVVAAANEYKVTLPVSENFILRITQGMPVQIRVDVAPDLLLSGTVTTIAAIDSDTLAATEDNAQSTGGTQVATYPVTVDVADSPALTTLRAGMNVQVIFIGSNQLPPNSWLVPATSLEDQRDDRATIQIIRGNSPEPLEIIVTDRAQGEWVVIQSEELQEGDMVVGTVASYLDQSPFGEFGPGTP